MICPKCNQKTNHVTNTKFFDEFNYLERERECRTPNCFNKFITYEQISPGNKKIPKLKIPKVKKRKIEPRTQWQEFRFQYYASYLVGNVFDQLLILLKKNNLEEKFDEQTLGILEIKNKTNIRDKVFIGSNSSLVAPITINENSVVGAGSVITKNVNKNALALTRSSQIEIKNYKRKK